MILFVLNFLEFVILLYGNPFIEEFELSSQVWFISRLSHFNIREADNLSFPWFFFSSPQEIKC